MIEVKVLAAMTKESVSKHILDTCYGNWVAAAKATSLGNCLMVRAALRRRTEFST